MPRPQDVGHKTQWNCFTTVRLSTFIVATLHHCFHCFHHIPSLTHSLTHTLTHRNVCCVIAGRCKVQLKLHACLRLGRACGQLHHLMHSPRGRSSNFQCDWTVGCQRSALHRVVVLRSRIRMRPQCRSLAAMAVAVTVAVGPLCSSPRKPQMVGSNRTPRFAMQLPAQVKP